MNKRRILINSIVSTLLLTGTLSAQTMTCKDGKCYIDISKLSPSRSVESKINTFKTFKKINYTTNITNNSSTIETIVLDHSKYVMNENEKNNYLLNNVIFYNAEDTIVLEHSKYVMTETEKETYYINERINEAELENELIVPTINIEDKIPENIMLPHSELYCDNTKQAIFHPDTNYYECV